MSVTRTTTTSWLSRLLNSFVGALIGIALFFGSFFVLWQNEGRTDLSKIADDSIGVSAASVDPANDGKFVAVSGALTTDEPLGDPQYLASGDYLQLSRNAEMYAWVENEDTETRTNTGGSETSTTTYTYAKEWTSSPESSSNFEVPSGHQNPEMSVQDDTFTASSATLGAYNVDMASLGLPSESNIPLAADQIPAGVRGTVKENFLYLGAARNTPQVGDVRLSYSALTNGLDVTAFGTQEGNSLTSYTRGDTTLYQAYNGTRADALDEMHTSYVVMGWIFRVIGFLMMWFGMLFVLGPISTFLDFLPFLGSLSRTAMGFLTFGIALLFTFVTVILGVIFHNLIALIIVLLLLIGIGVLIARRKPAVQPKLA